MTKTNSHDKSVVLSGNDNEPLHIIKNASIRTSTPLALENGRVCEIVSFEGLYDSGEHIALIYPFEKNINSVPLVRLHSECLTGDVLGSAHCDCGPQLRHAQQEMSQEGGVLLYLRQEGRGVGLYNKIDAYHLQNTEKLDTFAAGNRLGHGEDTRNFAIAAQMLSALQIDKIRLITNNPEKARTLSENGIRISEIIKAGPFENACNKKYLEAKRLKGHRL